MARCRPDDSVDDIMNASTRPVRCAASTTIVESGLDIPDRHHDRPPRRYVRSRPALSVCGPWVGSFRSAYALFTLPAKRSQTDTATAA